MPQHSPQSLIEALIAPVFDIWSLARHSLSLRAELARREMAARLRAMGLAIGLLFAALALVILALILAVKTGLIGLMVLGLSPFYAHLLTLAVCVIVILLLIWAAIAALKRVIRPFAPLTAPTGETLPVIRPQGGLAEAPRPDPANDPR